jgi:hypothetical protein
VQTAKIVKYASPSYFVVLLKLSNGKQRNTNKNNYGVKLHIQSRKHSVSKGPFTLAIFAAISSAIFFF